MRKLDILVPVYDEGPEVLKNLLDSIAIQQNVDMKDVGVIICADGKSGAVPRGLLDRYPFHAEFHRLERRGVSATRNACLDRSDAEYVMFCDADDMFMNACGLWILFREMAAGFDSLASVFVEETRANGQPTYINREMDSTFVHGKVHRRAYLLEKEIRWNEKLTIHEDSYFNILCQSLSTNVKYCPTAFYLWKWRDASVCRHDPKYILRTYGNMLDSNDALVDEFLRRCMPEKAQAYVAFMVFDAYYTMNKPAWISQENKAYRDTTEKRFKEYFLKHEDLWNAVGPQERAAVSNGVRSRSVSEGMYMEAVTIDGWLRHVRGL